MSSSFGSIDLAVFAKASAYWYRSGNQSDGGYVNDVPVDSPSLVNPALCSILYYACSPGDMSPRADAIVVQASVEGLGSSTVSIPVSSNLLIHRYAHAR